MTYATTLALVFGKRPIWLYEFVRGGVTTRLTSAASNYTDGDGVTWTSAVISHSRFRITSATGRAQTIVGLPQSSSLAQGYLTDLSYETNTLTIYHEFKDQSPQERVTKFRGRVISSRPMLSRIMLVAENRFTEFRRKGLSAVMQRPCRHALYHAKDGIGCGLTLADWQTSATLTAISGNNLTVSIPSSGSGAVADGYYSGGVFEWNSKKQMIVRHSGSTIRLLGPVDGLEAALDAASPSELTVSLAPGCDLSRATCNDRFNNLVNHGGFPWMTESPYGKAIF